MGLLDPEATRRALDESLDETLPLLARMSTATDARLRSRVLSLVPRLLIERAAAGRTGGTGTGRLRPAPVVDGADLDLDSSLDAVLAAGAQARPVGLDELTGRAWRRPAWAVCLLIDRSGSMNGPRLATAAMAAAACALRVTGELVVVAFDARTEVLLAPGAPRGPEDVVGRILGLRGHGITCLGAGLRAAAAQLAGTRARRRVTLLLSDCRATDRVDPVPVARSLEELVVIAPADDSEQARDLAGASGARFAPIGSLEDLPGILEELLAS